MTISFIHFFFAIILFYYFVYQARAKLPKKRRRVLPVEPTRGPRLPGQTPNQGCPGGPCGGGMGVPVQNRRMNAIKSNHPKDMMGTVPKLGK